MPFPDSTYEEQWRNARAHPLMRARDPHKAALLAAAPELLAALRRARDELIWAYEELYPDDEADNDITAVIDLAREVIAKAEGRE